MTLSIGDRMRLCPHKGIRVVDEIKELLRCDDCGATGHSARPIVGDNERRCAGCGVVKPLGEFWRKRSAPKGRSYRCRSCEYERANA